MINMITRTTELSRKSTIQLVTSSLLVSDFVWQKNMLIVEVLGSIRWRARDTVIISSERWSGNNIHIIAVLRSGFIAVSDYDGSFADLLYVDAETGFVECTEQWNMNHFWMRSALTLDRIVERPSFGCALSQDELQAIVIGPAFDDFSGWGCRVMDLTDKHFVKDIRIDGYSWAAAAAYHTKAGHKRQIAFVCCKRFEFITNYARPNMMGTLVLFDTLTNEVIATLNNKSVSSEVLKFSHDGRFIVTRLTDEQCLAVLDSTELVVLRTFPHNFHCFPYSYHILYPIFPLFSNCGTKLAVLEWNVQKGDPDVWTFDLPQTMISLKGAARIAILQSIQCASDVDALPIPASLKCFLHCLQ